MKYISKTVWVLSLVSLFTDIASEMLYPILPIYLKSIGYSILFIGILEGITEVVAGYGKGYFGCNHWTKPNLSLLVFPPSRLYISILFRIFAQYHCDWIYFPIKGETETIPSKEFNERESFSLFFSFLLEKIKFQL